MPFDGQENRKRPAAAMCWRAQEYGLCAIARPRCGKSAFATHPITVSVRCRASSHGTLAHVLRRKSWASHHSISSVLTTSTFDTLKVEPTIGRAEALQRAMLAYMNNASSPRYAYPAFWAAFEIVGEGAGRDQNSL
jgi:hypothetical protein